MVIEHHILKIRFTHFILCVLSLHVCIWLCVSLLSMEVRRGRWVPSDLSYSQ